MSGRSKRREPRLQSRSPVVRLAWPWRLALIAGLALLLRLTYLFELRDSPFFSVVIGDSLQYDTWALALTAGDWVGTQVFYQSPLYPYLLAIFFSVAGHDLFGVRVVQASLGAASAVLLAIAGRRFFDARTGVIAGVLLAGYPAAIFFDGLIQKSSLDIFLTCALLALLGVCRTDDRARWFVLAGATLGALALNRENARVLYPVIAVWLYLDAPSTTTARRRRWAPVGLFTLGMAILLLPVAARNFYVGGEFLVSTSQSGPNFYIGNRLGASGVYEPLVEGRSNAQVEREDATRLAQEGSGRVLSPGEVSDYWWQRALADIRRAPGAWARLMARKAWLTVASAEPPDTETLEAYADRSVILRGLRWFTFGLVMAVAVFGAWRTKSRWRATWVLSVCFVVLALSVVMFFVLARYRIPLAPIAMLFAAAGLASLPDLRRATYREWVPAALVTLGAGVLLHLPATISSDDTYLNYGGELVRLGRPGEAIPLLEAAVLSEPGEPDPKLTLALALQQSQQTQRATEVLRTAATMHPRHFPAQVGLAAALHQQGRTAEAIPYYREALRLRPDSTEALSNMALALQQTGDTTGAVEHFERALRLQPASVPLRMNLCAVLQQAGSAARAVECLQKAVAVARDPRAIIEAEYALAQALLNVDRLDAAAASLQRALAIARTEGVSDVIGTMEEALRIIRSKQGK